MTSEENKSESSANIAIRGSLQEKKMNVFDVADVYDVTMFSEKNPSELSGNTSVLGSLRGKKMNMTTRQFKKRGNYKSWTNEDMKNALKAFAQGMTVNRASTMFNIPKTTFKRKIIEYDLENINSRNEYLLKEGQSVEINSTAKAFNAEKHNGESQKLVKKIEVQEINQTTITVEIPEEPYLTETNEQHLKASEEFQQEIELNITQNKISKEIASRKRTFECKINHPHSAKCDQPEDLPKEAARMLNKSAKEVEISKNTLKNINQQPSEKKNDLVQALPKEFENTPVKDPCSTSNSYGLTKEKAYETTKTHNLDTTSVDEKKQDGNSWQGGSIKRPSELNSWQENITSFTTGSLDIYSFNQFFDILKSLIDENRITSSRIFNMDEMSHSVVIHSEKVTVQSGKHRFASAASCEKTENITGLYAANAAGSFIPPMLIFARDNIEDSLIPEGAPLGTIFKCQGDGLMNANIFTEWMAHFIDTVKPNISEKVLLILDGYKSYIRTFEANELARENGVLILSLPLQYLRNMRPLDITFFKVLNSYIGLAITNHLKENSGKPLTAENIACFIGTGFLRAATIETAVGGFRETGLWPVDSTNMETSNPLLKGTPVSEERAQKQRSHKQKFPKKIIQNMDQINDMMSIEQAKEQILNVNSVNKNPPMNFECANNQSSMRNETFVTNTGLNQFQSESNLHKWAKRTRQSNNSIVNSLQQTLEHSTDITRQNWISAL